MTYDLIYLDHAATTPVAPAVREAMLPYLGERFGNASSIHSLGREARGAIDAARDAVAALIGADYSEIYFTGSGTEADNLALLGAVFAAPDDRRHLVTTAIEHHAVLNATRFLQAQGCDATIIPVDADGLVGVDAIRQSITKRTTLVSVMHANNEIGTIQPISAIAAAARAEGVLFHTDAIQSAGIVEIDVRAIACDLLSLSAHKLYGPKGIGALYIRQGVAVSPIVYGGAQEREKRAGTENVAAIVGFGAAAEIARRRRREDSERLAQLRDRLLSLLVDRVKGVHLNGLLERRLANNLNVSIEGVEGATLLMNLDRRGIAASSGSACSSGSIEPSHVLKAIGLPDTLASSGIRFSLGRGTTDAEIDRAAAIFSEIIDRMRPV